MSKSKVFGVKQRRSLAKDRLIVQLEEGTKRVKDKVVSLTEKNIKRINKEISNLEDKKNYSRKNK